MEAKFIEYFENFHKNQKNTPILCAEKYNEIIESIQSTNCQTPNQTMEKNKLTHPFRLLPLPLPPTLSETWNAHN